MTDHADRSYGIIPLRRTHNDWEVLLIHQYSHIGDNSYWVFPKGHAEGKETPEVAARRELREETGLTVDRVVADPTFTLQYTFRFKGTLVQKEVTFFLGLVAPEATLTLDPNEVREARWLSLEAAAEQLDYDATKAMFERVIAYLRTVENLETS